jgi:hypothetical protein
MQHEKSTLEKRHLSAVHGSFDILEEFSICNLGKYHAAVTIGPFDRVVSD